MRWDRRGALRGASAVTLRAVRAGRQLSPGSASSISLGLCRSLWFAPRSPKHDPKTRSGSPTTAASAGDGLVLAGSPLSARAWRLSVARGRTAVLVPGGRGRPARVVVLQRHHPGLSVAVVAAGPGAGTGGTIGPRSDCTPVAIGSGPVAAVARRPSSLGAGPRADRAWRSVPPDR